MASHGRVKELFFQALNQPEARRAVFLKERCQGDSVLEKEVFELLEAHDQADDLLMPLELPIMKSEALSDLSTDLGGRFTLDMLLGEGGMGSVYLADQHEPVERKVALKIIKPGLDSKATLARFEVERNMLARMNHPHIANIFDVGTTHSGRPYFILEWVNGEPVTQYCDERSLGVSERLKIVHQCCLALQHAHQKGVIHRDIKPSNILVMDSPEGAVPKIIDFGISKAVVPTENRHLTATYHLLGTPAYMSPEQAAGQTEQMDTRSDLYALGTVLYELLTGSHPYGDPPPQTMLQKIIEGKVPLPSRHPSFENPSVKDIASARGTQPEQLARSLNGDLDWMVLKAMALRPEDRYASASEFAADIRRFLNHEPLLARKPTWTHRLKLIFLRHKAAALAFSFLFAALILGAAGTTFGWLKAAQAQQRERVAKLAAQESADRAQAMNDFLTDLIQSADPFVADRELRMVDILDQAKGQVDRKFANQPVLAAGMAHVLAETYRHLGYVEQSEGLYKKSIHLHEENQTTDWSDRLKPRDGLALAYLDQGKYEETEAVLTSLLAQKEVRLGKDHCETLYTKSLLISLWVSQAKNQQAIDALDDFYQKVQRSCDDVPWERNYFSLLGVALMKQGHYKESVRFLQGGYESCLEELGENNFHTDSLAANLGRSLQKAGFLNESEKLLRQSVAFREDALGEEHQKTMTAKNNLALTLTNLDKLDEAETLHRQVLSASRNVFGEDHPEYITHLNNYAHILNKRGRYASAEVVYRQMVGKAEKTLGPKHQHTLIAKHNLATTYLRQKRFDKSMVAYREVAELSEEILGEDHPHTLQFKTTLIAIYKAKGKMPEAIALVRDQVKRMGLRIGFDHQDTIIAQVNLIKLLLQDGAIKEAEQSVEEVMKILENTKEENPPHFWKVKICLGQVFAAQDKDEKALDQFREAYRGLKDHIGPTNLETLHAYELKASQLVKMDAIEEALIDYQDLLKIAETQHEGGRKYVLLARQQLGKLFLKLGKYSEAEPHLVMFFNEKKEEKGEAHKSTELARKDLVSLKDAWENEIAKQRIDQVLQ